VLTTLDQAFSSASNFLVGVAVARIAGPAGLGGFSVAYSCWLVVASLHRSLVTDPMAIENDAAHPDAFEKLRRGLASELTIAVVGAAVLFLAGVALLLGGQHAFGLGLVAVAPWLPCLVVQDFWRWMGFMQRKPGKALANDTVFNVAFGLCFLAVYLAGSRSIVLVIGSWGFGAFAGFLFGLWQFSVRPTLRGGISGLRSRWHLSKWLAGNSLTNWGAGQASTILSSVILGPAGLGGLRAAQTLVQGPTMVLIQAGGSIGLPEASRAFEERGWTGLRKVAFVVTAASLASIAVFGAIVIVLGSTLLRLVYGPAFAKYWPAADLSVLATLIAMVGIGPILVLKASKYTRLLFRVQVISFAASVPAVIVLALLYGVSGAAAASIVSAVAGLSSVLWYQRVARKNVLQAPPEESPAPQSEHSGGLELPVEGQLG
jgi:O-antigen/teichoic acid export membrane protein